MIRAAIFDMDGTLIDSERVYLRAFRAAARAIDADVEDDLYLSLVGMGEAHSMVLLRGAMGDAQAEAFARAWNGLIGPMMAEPIAPLRGAVELLDALRGRMPLGVATSTRTASAHGRLERAGLLHFFDEIVGGDAVAQGKPAPDIFLLAAERLGTAPEACAAFEDSETGTRAALAAGMRVVQVPDMAPARAPGAGQIVAEDLLAGARALGLIELAA